MKMSQVVQLAEQISLLKESIGVGDGIILIATAERDGSANDSDGLCLLLGSEVGLVEMIHQTMHKDEDFRNILKAGAKKFKTCSKLGKHFENKEDMFPPVNRGESPSEYVSRILPMIPEKYHSEVKAFAQVYESLNSKTKKNEDQSFNRG